MLDWRDLWGWILFFVGALIFLAMGIRDRDALLASGSAAFVVGCALLLWATPRR